MTAPTAAQRAETWLRAQLPADGSPVPSVDVRTAAEAAGLNWRTVQRAARAIGVVITNTGGPTGRATLWTRPVADPDPEPIAPNTVTDEQRPSLIEQVELIRSRWAATNKGRKQR